MAVNDYLRNCKYNLNNLDNYIYLYEFNEPILNYITDDAESNGSSINLKGSSYRIFCESVSYSSTSSVDNRFSFDNTLTVTLTESKEVTHYSIIKELLTNNWMVVFKNTDGDAFVMNAEFPVMVSYNYTFNDEKSPNNLVITFKALQNVPTINYRGSVTFSSTLRGKPCEYSISRLKTLKMIDMNKADIKVTSDGFDIEQKGEGSLKTIEFNPTSLSFVDSYDGREFSQQLSFQIPFDSYRFYFHYNLLEYLDNRYYALIETTNGNNILGGFRQGLFPSYSVSTENNENIITITLTARYTTYSVLGSDTMNITTNDGMTYKPILGECVNNVYTYTLIEQINSNGVGTNGYYCLEGFEDIYSDYTILGTYNQFDTEYGFKLTDFNIDCSEGCKIDGLPSQIQFTTSGETQCFQLNSSCSVTFEWNSEAITVDYDELTQKLCVQSLVEDGTFSIKATLTDGNIRYSTVVIGSGGITGDTTTTINITAQQQQVFIIPIKGLNNVKSITSTLPYTINENGNGYNITVEENTNVESRTFTITIVYNDNSIETINIIQDRIYYKIVQSEETQCYGNDLYYINKKYKGYNETDINIFVENIQGNVKENDSISCLDYDTKTSACTACFEGYIYTLYDYSKDGTTVVLRYEKTEETCTDEGTTQYQVNTAKTVCVDNVAYYKEDLYGLNCQDNTTYIKLYPNIEQVSETVAEGSNACEVINPDNQDGTVLYRWVDTDETYCVTEEQETNCVSSTTSTYCDGYNLYEETIYYVDALCNGNYIQSGSPINTLIQTNSTECGYEEDTSGSTSGDTTGCTSSTTYSNYQMLAIGVNDMNGNGLGGFSADGDNIINTNLSVAWNESIIIDECSYTYDTTVINSDCTSSTTENTGTTFTTTYSTTENSSTEYQETVTITIKVGLTTIGYVTFYRNAKPSDTSGSTSGDTTGCTSSTTYDNFTYISITLDDGTVVTPINSYEYYTNKTVAWNEVYDGVVSVSYTKDKTVINADCTSATTTEEYTTTNFTYDYSPSGNNETTEDREVFANMFESGTSFIGRIYYTQEGKPSDTTGGTECTNDTLTFEFSGSSGRYRVNSYWRTATTSPYSENISKYSYVNYLAFGDTITKIDSIYTSSLTGLSFTECTALTYVNTSCLDTSNITSMTAMFQKCSGLTSLDVSNFDTSNVIYMNAMFERCSGLTSLDVSNFDTSNVTTMNSMFNQCINLTSLDVSNFDTSNVTDMGQMFFNCNKLTSLNLSNFNTSGVTSLYGMFYTCTSLTTLDLSSFDTSNVTNIYNIFRGCTSLTTINLSGWDLSNIEQTNLNNSNYKPFYGCDNLTTIICMYCNQTTIDLLNSIIPTNCSLVY